MISLPRAKKVYLLKMLEKMEQDLKAEAISTKNTGKEGESLATRSTDEMGSSSSSNKAFEYKRFFGDTADIHPREVVRIWMKIRKAYLSNCSPPTSLSESGSGGGEGKSTRVILLGPSALRDQVMKDFDVKLSSKEMAVLLQYFSNKNSTVMTKSKKNCISTITCSNYMGERDVDKLLR